MKNIEMQPQGIRPIHYQDDKNDLSIYTYLMNVEYQVRTHFEWDMNRPELEKDRNENKHWDIAKRMVERGGRRDVFLGTRECQGYVERCDFGEGKGYYDQIDLSFGVMLHGITYPSLTNRENNKGKMIVRLWKPQMKNGVITFIRPEECSIIRTVNEITSKSFEAGKNFNGLEEFDRKGEF